MSKFKEIEKYVLGILNDNINLESLKICYTGLSLSLKANQDFMCELKKQVEHLVWDINPESTISFIEFDTKKPLPIKIQSEYLGSNDVKIWFLPSYNLMLFKLINVNRSLVLYQKQSDSITSDSLRLILQVLVQNSSQPIHGGSVSWGEKSALVSNVGGSGKSSLIAASILKGATTTGDDFGRFNIKNDKVIVWSQFQTLKLAESSPTRPFLNTSPIYTTPSKQVFSVDSIAKNAMVKFHNVDFIVIPILGDRPKWLECASENSQKYVIPSSSILSYSKTQTIKQLKILCNLLPAYIFELGPNPIENSEFLREKLSG